MTLMMMTDAAFTVPGTKVNSKKCVVFMLKIEFKKKVKCNQCWRKYPDHLIK